MRFNGEIEVTGATMVVLDREIIFRREDGETYWRYETVKGGVVMIAPEVMSRKVQKYIDNPFYRVWVHEGAINIVEVGQ